VRYLSAMPFHSPQPGRALPGISGRKEPSRLLRGTFSALVFYE